MGQIGNLVKGLAFAADFKCPLPVHLEVALLLAVFHLMAIAQLIDGKALTHRANLHWCGCQSIKEVGVFKINLVGLLHFLHGNEVAVEQMDKFRVG